MRFALALLAALLIAPAAAQAAEPWQTAGQITDGLFDAQTELVLSDADTAAKDVDRAREAYDGEFARTLEAADANADTLITRGLRDAARGREGRRRHRARRARGAVRASLFRGAYAVTTGRTAAGDAATARRWLLLREYRTATRFTRPAPTRNARARPAPARQDLPRGRHAGDHRRTCWTPTRRACGSCSPTSAAASSRTSPPARPRPPPRPRATSPSSRPATPRTAAPRPPRGPRRRSPALPETIDAAEGSLTGFTAAPFTPEEAARRAQQLLQFLELVPVEYGRGVKDTNVTRDFEIQEAVAFRTGAVGAFADLARPARQARSRAARGDRRRRDHRARPDGRAGQLRPS